MNRRRRRGLLALGALLFALAFAGYAAIAPGSQVFGAVAVHGDRARPRVALTFDDGPDPIVTPRVLDALRDAGAHATFFLVGRRVAPSADLVRRIAAEGHEIGNHSFEHAALALHSGATIERSLADTQTAIASVLGSPPALFRPPYGLRDPRVLRIAADLGLRTVTWSASPEDWREPGADAIRERVLAKVGPGDIVLMHDGDADRNRGRGQTADALPEILAGLKRRGFELVTVGELLAPPD